MRFRKKDALLAAYFGAGGSVGVKAHKYISAETGPLQAEIRKIVKIMRHKG